MRIVLDLDEVLFHMFDKWLPMINSIAGTNLRFEHLKRYHYKHWVDDEGRMPTDDHIAIAIRMYITNNGYANQRSIEGMSDAMTRISNTNEYRMVTGRGHPQYLEHVKRQTEIALEREYPLLESDRIEFLHWTDSKGNSIAGADVVADDCLDHVMEARTRGICTLMPQKPWNRGLDDVLSARVVDPQWCGAIIENTRSIPQLSMRMLVNLFMHLA